MGVSAIILRTMNFAPSFFRRAPQVPRLALSLRRLAREVDAAWPDRETSSDGWIGDAAHLSRQSDHNPDSRFIVHALDVTAAGIRPRALVARAIKHPATEYVIWNERIWSRRYDFDPRGYDGPDPHVSHVHISIKHTRAAEGNRTRWLGT